MKASSRKKNKADAGGNRKASPRGRQKTQAVEPAPETEPVPAAEQEVPETAGDECPEALRARLLRLQADFDNFRKRVSRERDELYRRANTDILSELLPVLDHMDLAIEAAETHSADEAVVEGFKLVSEQLMTGLEKFGLKPVDAGGKAFDPNLHEAISRMPSDDVPEDKVIVQVRRGYVLGDRLLRAAQVVVSSGPASAADDGRQAGSAGE